MKAKQKEFLDLLFGEAKGDPKVAKQMSSYSDNTSVADILKGLEKEIEARTRKLIALHGPKAAFSIISIIENPSQLGNQLRLSAAKDFLDRAGFQKTEKVEIDASAPIFFLPKKDEAEE